MSIPRKEELSFRVLLYKEDGEWTAHALELDLIGSGESEDSALADLHKAVGCQISFAIQKKDISMLSREAPKEYFVRWKEAQEGAIEGLVLSNKEDKCVTVRATFLLIESSETEKIVKKARKGINAFKPELANA
ncbi:MAG: hypothetical protein WAK31_27800 [Chthoniobacterales bacterium]